MKKKVSEASDQYAGAGLSDKPSDNLSTLSFSPDEWEWIDALHSLDKHRDPQPLIKLLARKRVPKQVMPFLADLLDIKFRRPAGRPAPRYAAPLKASAYKHACDRVREFVEKGYSVKEAAIRVAPSFGLEAPKLADVFSGKSGYARAMRRRYRL